MTYNHDGEDTHYDAYDDAMTDEPSRFFGCVTIEAYQVVFINDGSGWQKPEQYLPELHGDEAEIAKNDDKFLSTQIDFSITPTDAARKIISRTVGAKNRKRPEFARVIRPSIEALAAQIAAIKGLQPGQFNPLKELSGMWVEGEFVPRPSNKPGETWTTLKFTCVFASQDECAAAADEAYNRDADDEPAAEVQDDGQDADKAKMVPFVASLWEQAGKDAAKMAELLADNPLLSTMFTMDSEEVLAVMGS